MKKLILALVAAFSMLSMQAQQKITVTENIACGCSNRRATDVCTAREGPAHAIDNGQESTRLATERKERERNAVYQGRSDRL